MVHYENTQDILEIELPQCTKQFETPELCSNQANIQYTPDLTILHSSVVHLGSKIERKFSFKLESGKHQLDDNSKDSNSTVHNIDIISFVRSPLSSKFKRQNKSKREKREQERTGEERIRVTQHIMCTSDTEQTRQ